MYLEFKDVDDPAKFCLSVICKEVKEDVKLVRQVFYVLLSAYTKNPMNLAINAPTGEGKSYVVRKVAELFPKSDIVYLASMTDKALFHRQGSLVVKDERGDHVPIDSKITTLDSQIEDKLNEVNGTHDGNLKKALANEMNELEQEKKDLYKNAKKLIDLNHTVLIFGDTPKMSLLEAIMSLLSHDKDEVEYQYVDTSNEFKTRSNILRGYPTVIFAAAMDYSKYPRWPEIQRRL
jgi:hypothetical protein